MRLRANGRETEDLPVETIRELLEHLGAHRMVVVEVNGEIVPREEFNSWRLSEGDSVEIVHFVGGGSGRRPARTEAAGALRSSPR